MVSPPEIDAYSFADCTLFLYQWHTACITCHIVLDASPSAGLVQHTVRLQLLTGLMPTSSLIANCLHSLQDSLWLYILWA